MKVVWMGQSGLLFVSGKDKIIIDPYLTNDLYKEDKNLRRGMKINKKFFRINPDIIILTNSYPDHTDLGTLKKYIYKSKKVITIICCQKSYEIIKESDMPKKCNFIVFEEGSEWTFKDINITAVAAKTNDHSAFGVLITDNSTGKIYYVASATLYNKHIFEDLPSNINTLFVPINGENGAMNIYDAKRFSERVGAVHTVPVHYGMFDLVDPEKLEVANKIIPQIYKVINLEHQTKKEISLDRRFNEQVTESKKENEAKPIIPALPAVESQKASKKRIKKLKNSQYGFLKKSFEVSEENLESTILAEFKDEGNESVEPIETIETSKSNEVDIGGEIATDLNSGESVTAIEAEKENFSDTEIQPENISNESKKSTKTDNEPCACSQNDNFDSGKKETNSKKVSGSYASDGKDAFDLTSDEIIDEESDVNDRTETETSPKEESPEDVAEKLDAYMKEIEKFQRGDTADFSKIDSK